MKVNKKHFGLIIASLMALSFNSQFAQAARKTTEAFKPGKAYAFKKVGKEYIRLPQINPGPVVVKKTGVRIDRSNIYIGGYIVNTTDREIKHLQIFPSFADQSLNSSELAEKLNHKENSLAPRETRRFVIKRPVSEVAPLLSHSIPLNDNCILNCREVES
ncbi:MAG TPA: hypothetical protein DCG57_08020 [Candidatus Riflebacteria bacterium]|jgi:hypothetical protein|nr:MAG: hypothetical protein CVV41_00815 [Candidatus Riflebacteria bacterium HGW-Riflebacteria-1]HAE38571.1 hypothetical protein [Candidatus Riflebacteria bacterium]